MLTSRVSRRVAAWALLAMTGCSQLVGLDGDYQSALGDGGPGAGTGADSAPGQSGNVDGRPDGGDSPGTDSGTGSPDQGDAGVTNHPPVDGASTLDTGTSTSHDARVDGNDGSVATVTSPIQQVYAGATTLAAGASSQSVALSAIDPSRAFVVAGTSFDSTVSSDVEVTAQISSATELQLTRTASSGTPAIPVRYYVAAFQSGVQVQRGSTAMSGTSVAVPLPVNVDLTRSFPIVTYRNTGNTIGVDDFVRGELTAPGQLTLSIGLAAPNGIVEWQVVSFDGATVQSGTVTMSGGATSVTATPQRVMGPATWLLLSGEVSNLTGTTAELMVSGRVSSPTEVTVSRGQGGGTNKVTWYAVSFDNGTTVQSTPLAVSDSAASAAVALTHVAPLKSIAVSGGLSLCGGTTQFTAASNTGYGMFTLSLGTGATLEAVRGASGGTSNGVLDYSVIQFF